MASVWLAIDARNGRLVAVKRMNALIAEDVQLRQAFLDEAAIGLRLSHPNIVETVEVGDTLGEERYLVLELLRGRTVSELLMASLERKTPLPIGAVMTIVRDAARGLHHAHGLVDTDGQALEIVHRDVNPRNVFVCLDGVVKIIDFGIAKA